MNAMMKRAVMAIIRRAMPFTVVTKGGWLGFDTIQSACIYVGARGGGTVYVGPGTYFETIIVEYDHVNIRGAGRQVSILDGREHGTAILFEGNWCSMQDFTINTTPGQGANTGYCVYVRGSYFSGMRLASTSADAYAFYHDTGVACTWMDNTIPADFHDGYNAIDGTQDRAIYVANHVKGGGLLGYNVGGDHSIMVANSCDGTGAMTYGMIISANAANSTMVANNTTNVLSTDHWDNSTGATATNASNEAS